MSHLFLIHLLGVWLLLNQSSTKVSSTWWGKVIRFCDHRLYLEKMLVCSKATLETSVGLQSLRSTDMMSSSLNKDAYAFNMMPQQLRATTPFERQPSSLELQHEPVIKDSKPVPKELKYIIQNGQKEAEDNSPSESEYLALNVHSQQSLRNNVDMLKHCCRQYCTRRSMVKYC